MKSLVHWRPYLGWTKEPFVILTDHANLQYWKAPKNLNRRTVRWHADLQEYDYEIQYIPGKTNTPADALSRPPGVDQGKEDNQGVTMIAPERFKVAATLTQPTEERKRLIMALVHDHPSAGHPGRDETIRQTKKRHQWQGMNQWIADYVKGCATCQQNKVQTHKGKTPLYRITTPETSMPFQQIAMHLITGLPNHQGKDAILTIVDHGCSRAAIFLPCTSTITGLGIAQLYLDNVYRWFGLPKKMISDRDPRFTSHFGRALTKKLGIEQNLSSAFHPQTDGLTERKNQWVEQYLRLVTSASPESWTSWLTIASAVHNNRKNSTTGLSPNQILLGYETTLVPEKNPVVTNSAAEQRVQDLMNNRAEAVKAINKAARQLGGVLSRYRKGDQVWLEATHLLLRHQKTKLAPKRYGPFKITKEISPVAYRIELPPSWNIHNVFHASLLSPYHETKAHGTNFSRPPPDLIKGENEYEIERVINHRCHGRARKLQYLVKWKGYPESDNTWEPEEQLHAPLLLKAYHRHTPLNRIKARAMRPGKACPRNYSAPGHQHIPSPTTYNSGGGSRNTNSSTANPDEKPSFSFSINYPRVTVSSTLVSAASLPASTTPPDLQLLDYLSEWALKYKTEPPVSSVTTHSPTQDPRRLSHQKRLLPVQGPHTSPNPMANQYRQRAPSLSSRRMGTRPMSPCCESSLSGWSGPSKKEKVTISQRGSDSSDSNRKPKSAWTTYTT